MESYIFLALLIAIALIVSLGLACVARNKAVIDQAKQNKEILERDIEICKLGKETTERNMQLIRENAALKKEINSLNENNVRLGNDNNYLLNTLTDRDKEIEEKDKEIEKLKQENADLKTEKKEKKLPKKPAANPRQIYVRLLGVDWCTENLTDEQGNDLFTQKNALKLAAEQDLKLPSIKLFKALVKLPSCWDEELKGRWFAENEYDLKNPKKSLFFPAAGIRNIIDVSSNSVGSNGYYWSSTVTGTYSYSLFFNSGTATPAYNYGSEGGFSVRCIRK